MNRKYVSVISLLWTSLAILAPLSHADEEVAVDRPSDFAVGFDIDSYANNFAGGINFTSPRFFNDTSDVQLTADIAWVQGVQNGASTTTWVPYGLFKVGYFSGRFIEGTPLRVYGGGGLVILAPSSNLSTSSVGFGGFGVAGLELLVNKKRSKGLFLEFGGMGTGATADKLVNSPIYANGFTVSWGYKYYL